jgi:hypothetical protein
MDPGAHGGTLAHVEHTSAGYVVELRKLQPTREYAGDGEAAEVGFPFWTREGYYTEDDLSLDDQHVQGAMQFCDLDANDLPTDQVWRLVALACACLDCGHLAEEGPAGWAKHVVPWPVYWSARPGKRPMGWRFLADEDRDFRAMLREARR